jgi:hypothetical protein
VAEWLRNGLQNRVPRFNSGRGLQQNQALLAFRKLADSSRQRFVSSNTMAISPNNPASGERFSQVYLNRGKPTEDSPRVRRRIAALIDVIQDLDDLGAVVPRELGLEMRWTGLGPNWPAFLNGADLRDLLDLITLAYRNLENKKSTGLRRMNAPAQWIDEVRRIFEEENFGYTIDDKGGVHYRLDEEFARARSATIAALGATRYANVLDSFERGMTALAGAPPDGKNGIRLTFAAVEGLFRLIIPPAQRLGAAELDGMVPLINRVYAADPTALRSSNKMINSMKDWTDAAHFYRHEQGAQEIAQPPLGLAIYLISSGASHLRWLSEIDARLLGQ